MRGYYITDRHHLGGVEPLVRCIERNLASGVEMIQIREKDLTARELARLVRRICELPNPHGSQILVNTRFDIAMACGAAGVHLTSDAIAPSEVRRVAPEQFVIGVSCHTLDEVKRAETEGADFVVFGPVFAPISKVATVAPCGWEGLARAAAAVRIPVWALGGINQEYARLCSGYGAAGVAGITLFQEDTCDNPPFLS